MQNIVIENIKHNIRFNNFDLLVLNNIHIRNTTLDHQNFSNILEIVGVVVSKMDNFQYSNNHLIRNKTEAVEDTN